MTRPALVLIDTAYLDRDDAAPARELAESLLAAARSAGVPVLHTGLAFRADGVDGGHFFARNPDLGAFAGIPVAHAPGLEPTADEAVIPRPYPSAFFGTSLAASLRGLHVGEVVIAGARTSEGVRATAVDALQHGFRPIVVADAVADTDRAEHDTALRALGARYAEVVSSASLVARLGSGYR